MAGYGLVALENAIWPESPDVECNCFKRDIYCKQSCNKQTISFLTEWICPSHAKRKSKVTHAQRAVMINTAFRKY